MAQTPLADDATHHERTHKRWSRRVNRRPDSPAYEESWRTQQCGGCGFWVPLSGGWGAQWGACSNPEAPFDGRVVLVRDGCGHHVAQGAAGG